MPYNARCCPGPPEHSKDCPGTARSLMNFSSCPAWGFRQIVRRVQFFFLLLFRLISAES
jgi:hypothetical protein